MKKLLLFFGLGLIFFSTNIVFAFDIVYPKTKTRTINSQTAFFIGASKTPLFVNGSQINLHPSGGFAHFVKLHDGINTFKFKSADKEEIYTITKAKPKISAQQVQTNKLTEYGIIKPLEVTSDNTPLRSTPVNSGINRLSHLQKGVLLTADGEKSGFYRIKLNDSKKVWVSKNNVKETSIFSPAKILGYKFEETKNDYIFYFSIDKKIPYIITESEPLKIEFFNVEKESSYSFPYKAKTGKSNLIGYGGYYTNNGEFIFKIRKPLDVNIKKPLKDIKIAVDPGHGGKEIGTTGCFGDKEKDVVLKISKYLEHELKLRGADVYMTRTSDVDSGLYDRVKFANEKDTAFFVSVHNNALPETLNPNLHRGTSVYYYYDEAKPLAQTILDTMVSELGTNNDNLHQASFAVIRNTNALSVLIEIAYLINPYDNELLTNHEFQKRSAKAIADGIEKYILMQN